MASGVEWGSKYSCVYSPLSCLKWGARVLLGDLWLMGWLRGWMVIWECGGTELCQACLREGALRVGEG